LNTQGSARIAYDHKKGKDSHQTSGVSAGYFTPKTDGDGAGSFDFKDDGVGAFPIAFRVKVDGLGMYSEEALSNEVFGVETPAEGAVVKGQYATTKVVQLENGYFVSFMELDELPADHEAKDQRGGKANGPRGFKEKDRFTTGGVEYAIQRMGYIVECIQTESVNEAFPEIMYLEPGQLQFVDRVIVKTANGNGFRIGDHVTMGGVEYMIETMGDVVECRQHWDSGEFPTVVYLAPNQLEFTQRADRETAAESERNAEGIGMKEGDRIAMGGIEYLVEKMGDFVECARCGDDEGFPKTVYLAMNQMKFVERKQPDLESEAPVDAASVDEAAGNVNVENDGKCDVETRPAAPSIPDFDV